MKINLLKAGFLFLVSCLLISCRSTTVPTTSVQYNDNYYVKLENFYLLERGMDYATVKDLLKADPKEVLMSVNDNCMIAVYDLKGNYRKHYSPRSDRKITDLNPEITKAGGDQGIQFFPSKSKSNLTYQIDNESPSFYVIFDGKSQRVRSYYSKSINEEFDEHQEILKRAFVICEGNQEKINEMVSALSNFNAIKSREKEIKANSLKTSSKSLLPTFLDKKEINEAGKESQNSFSDAIKAQEKILEAKRYTPPYTPKKPKNPVGKLLGILLLSYAVIGGIVYLGTSL